MMFSFNAHHHQWSRTWHFRKPGNGTTSIQRLEICKDKAISLRSNSLNPNPPAPAASTQHEQPQVLPCAEMSDAGVQMEVESAGTSAAISDTEALSMLQLNDTLDDTECNPNPKENAANKTNSSNSSGSQSESGAEKILVPNESRPIIAAEGSTISPALKCPSQDITALKKEIETLFSFSEGAVAHNFYKCTSDHCQHLTFHEQSRLKTCRDRFVHSWLFDKTLNVCQKTGIAWSDL
ncbi:hypothetical protein OS493_000717 [Desmophyllum pertusum]|uniref:Uncharacterized protein n=1 Tax=Desmophyllum pertusum TaxID=174260 RepID=A0A9X0A7R6_9CNID|nr:hypothetical protein OS493_000717 [Desmophyllum pertusum]